MFSYAEKTNVNMQFKMLELFKTIQADKTVKNDASNVTKVVLANVLSPERTKLEPSENVPEIYIFDIELNSNVIPTKFLDALNKSINFQTLIRVKHNGATKYYLAIKVFIDEKLKIIKTLQSEWQKEQCREFPITTKLENVFKEMIAVITQYKFRSDEDFDAYTERLKAIQKLKAEIDKQSRAVNNECQPNLRMELNHKLKRLQGELYSLER